MLLQPPAIILYMHVHHVLTIVFSLHLKALRLLPILEGNRCKLATPVQRSTYEGAWTPRSEDEHVATVNY